MNRVLSHIKEYLFDIDGQHASQFFNYITVVVLAVVIKIFFILMNIGEAFVSQFEICVWVFMVIWLVLRMIHSTMSLEGYYSLASVFCLLYIIIPGSNTWLIRLSTMIVFICITIKIIVLVRESGRMNKLAKLMGVVGITIIACSIIRWFFLFYDPSQMILGLG